jgi:hypothetical protein
MGSGSAEGAAGPSNKGRAPMRLLKCPGCHAGRTARDHEAIDRKLIVAARQLERPEPRSCFPLLATDGQCFARLVMRALPASRRRELTRQVRLVLSKGSQGAGQEGSQTQGAPEINSNALGLDPCQCFFARMLAPVTHVTRWR